MIHAKTLSGVKTVKHGGAVGEEGGLYPINVTESA